MEPLLNMLDVGREAVKVVISFFAGIVQLLTGVSLLEHDTLVAVLLLAMCVVTALAGVAHIRKLQEHI